MNIQTDKREIWKRKIDENIWKEKRVDGECVWNFRKRKQDEKKNIRISKPGQIERYDKKNANEKINEPKISDKENGFWISESSSKGETEQHYK